MLRNWFGLITLMLALAEVRAADFQPVTLVPGAKAPDFNLPGVDGRNYALQDFAPAKVLVVVFTCNHCPSAQYYEPRLKAFAADYKDKGVALVAIMPNDPKSVRLDELGYTDLGDTFAEMKIRAKDRGFNYPYLFDGETESVAQAYGPVATPHVFVFDASRTLRYVGAFDDAERVTNVKRHYVQEAVEALLNGQEPPVTKTKIVGCSIKWAAKEGTVNSEKEKLEGEPVSVSPIDGDKLKDLRKNDSGKFRLINFWATWCAPCVAEFPEFVTMNRMYRQRDFELITVAVNDPDEEKDVLGFLRKQHASNQNYLFATANRDKLIDAFDPAWQGEVPNTLLIDPDGKIIFHATARIDPIELRRVIVKALNARQPW